jgi:hypothetical protein
VGPDFTVKFHSKLHPKSSTFPFSTKNQIFQDYRKSIFSLSPKKNYFSLKMENDILQLISHSTIAFCVTNTGKKDEKRENPLSVIGSFVCYSINCTYQILSAFICAFSFGFHCENGLRGRQAHEKGISGQKSIKPLLSQIWIRYMWQIQVVGSLLQFQALLEFNLPLKKGRATKGISKAIVQ